MSFTVNVNQKNLSDEEIDLVNIITYLYHEFDEENFACMEDIEEMAGNLGYPKTIARVTLRMLQNKGLVECDPYGRGYKLSDVGVAVSDECGFWKNSRAAYYSVLESKDVKEEI